MRRFAPILLFLLAAAPAAGGPPKVVPGFRTPTGNIGCQYGKGFGGPYLRCDIRSGLKPKPPRPKGCVDLEWGDSFEMNATGRVHVTCHGDTAIDPRSRVLRYGQTWMQYGFVCTSKRVGLRCRNKSRHGFFLSHQRSYRF